ncbi:TetR/AcrR family transcriptional regulator [Sphingomonas sp. JC676]|uniref:TetR/AcrR family transcriptional regulator n=1 Tax=Sphingomonas sp. JC676 TaxID=2768065 RepID=UPI00223BD91A|nr:TetR/AcrR family transcriptional regulator [Sphingomonas sp. JC676]
MQELILAEGQRLLAEVGYAGFSAREVAKRIGYSIGTIYNVFGSHDALLTALNSRTFVLWAQTLHDKLAQAGEDRIAALVQGYFDFAEGNSNLWMAIYDHRLPPNTELPEQYRLLRAGLTNIVEEEIARALPHMGRATIAALTRSLVATVHGHCAFALNGTFLLLGEEDPRGAALTRVRETLAANNRAGAR